MTHQAQRLCTTFFRTAPLIHFSKAETIKTSISDHFAIFSAIKLSNEKTRNQRIKIEKIFFSDKNKESFKQDLQKINWEELNILNCKNTLYKNFIKIYFSIYDKNFPLPASEVKLKDLQTPWMSKAMRKSSNQKQKLYVKFLRSKTPKDELTYKNYKNLVEKFRKKSDQNYYSNLLGKIQRQCKTAMVDRQRNHRKSSVEKSVSNNNN